MSISIDVGYFDLGNSAIPRLSDNKACAASITGVKVNKIDYVVDGFAATFPDENGPKDAVKWLQANGWKPTEMVGTGQGPNATPDKNDDESGQAASFGKSGQFTSMHIDYESPVKCACDKGSKTRSFRWTVDYDRSSNAAPTTKLVETNPDPNVPADQRDKQLSPYTRQKKIANNPSTYSVTEEEVVTIPCLCDPLSPCEARFTVHFTYTTSVVPD